MNDVWVGCSCTLHRSPITGHLVNEVTSDHAPDCPGPARPVGLGKRPDVDHEAPPPPVDWKAQRAAFLQLTNRRRNRRVFVH
jgi:hypothetical protein